MLLLAAWDVVMLRAAAVAAAAAAMFNVLMPRAAADVSGQLTTARVANTESLPGAPVLVNIPAYIANTQLGSRKVLTHANHT